MLKILYTIEKCAPRHQQGATHNLESTRVYNFLFLYNAVVYNPSLCVSFEAAKSDCYTRFIMPACRDRISSGVLSLRPFIVSTVHFRIINDVVGSNFRTRKSFFYSSFLLSIRKNAKSQLDFLRGIFFNI